MAGDTTIFDSPMKNGEASLTLTAMRGCIYDVSANWQVVYPTSANVKGFAGVVSSNILAGKVGPIRKIGTEKVKISGTVVRGDNAYLSGTDGRFASIETNVTGTPQTWNRVGQFEESGAANDEAAMRILQPGDQWIA